MVETRREPAGGCVTGRTVCAKLTGVLVVVSMTGITIGRRALENVVDMATGASHLDMFTSQLESQQIMVEIRRKPACGCVAGRAGRAELTVVDIFRSMTGKTVGGCASIDIIDMTRHTSNLGVFTIQLKSEQVVIESRRFPSIRRMAG